MIDYMESFNNNDLAKTINRIEQMKFITSMELNHKTYMKLKSHGKAAKKIVSAVGINKIPLEINENIKDNKVKIIYNNGDKEETAI